nr:MAG TPA: hypothetical protein [Caudoviricetes sp.]
MAFSINVSKKVAKTGFRNTLIEAVKAANPSLSDLNFDDFDFKCRNNGYAAEDVKRKIARRAAGFSEGMVVKPQVEMSVKFDNEIKRKYTENSHSTMFTITGPDADEFIKKHVHVENLSELTWDDYDTVLNELKKFTNDGDERSGQVIGYRAKTENPNSKYLYLGVNTAHGVGNQWQDVPSALLSYRYEADKMDENFKVVYTFHFTRADVEDKRDLRIDNNNLTVGENGMAVNL